MRAYVGVFKKKNGETRKMYFAQLDDLPEDFFKDKIVGSGPEKIYPEGMELVWDLEEENFRVFNWATAQGGVAEIDW